VRAGLAWVPVTVTSHPGVEQWTDPRSCRVKVAVVKPRFIDRLSVAGVPWYVGSVRFACAASAPSLVVTEVHEPQRKRAFPLWVVKMKVGFAVRRASHIVHLLLRHPRQAKHKVSVRLERRRDSRELANLAVPQSDLYHVSNDWERRLHEALGVRWPCAEAAPFADAWDATVSDVTSAGMRVGLDSYAGWNDGDKAECQAIWCVIAHTRPTTVVETGVAHGFTTGLILKGLELIGHGHLWSIDLPADDPALHSEIGIAVPKESRSRWTYLEGTSRDRLPPLVRSLGGIDLFVHDSLHTGRNVCFELDTVWPALRPGAVAIVDDVERNLGFSKFVTRTAPPVWFGAKHVTGPGLWAVAVKGQTVDERQGIPPALG
jgi:Methyltransferase domain